MCRPLPEGVALFPTLVFDRSEPTAAFGYVQLWEQPDADGGWDATVNTPGGNPCILAPGYPRTRVFWPQYRGFPQ